MILAWPWFSLALALPLLVRFGLPPMKGRKGGNRLVHGGFPLLQPQTGQPLWRMMLCWCALVLALCRPQWQEPRSFTTRAAGTSSWRWISPTACAPRTCWMTESKRTGLPRCASR